MKRIPKTFILCSLLTQLALLLVACHTSGGPQLGSETHFLAICQSDDACGDGLHCICGACTLACSDDDQCAYGATCEAKLSRPLAQACAADDLAATCELGCVEDDDCASLDGAYSCDRGLCRQPAPECEAKVDTSGGPYTARDFILLGDNFLANSGRVAVELADLLRTGGVLSDDESLRDYSSSVVSPFGGAQDLFAQFELARNDGTAQVAILDAGGPDALLECDVDAATLCPNLQNGRDGSAALLAEMADAGLEHVVLFFYPRPDEAELAEKFNLLESELMAVCADSPVDCHFLSLGPLFEQRRATLLTGMGLFPTGDGALVTAGALFSILREQCIIR